MNDFYEIENRKN